MYVLLFIVGALTAAAGLALAAMGASVHDSAVASAIATPGTIAIVGGLLLIGLGLAVRELQRIERTLAARPIPRPARPSEAPAAAVPAAAAAAIAPAAGERPGTPARIAFPQRPKAEPRAQPTASAAAPAEEAAVERLREKFPTLVRLESVAAVEETSAAALTPARVERAEEEVGEARKLSIGGRPQAAAPVRAAPRLDANGRQPGAPERQRASVFEAFWPQGQRQRRNAATAGAPAPFVAPQAPPMSAAPAAAPVEPAHGSEASANAHPVIAQPWPAAGTAAAPTAPMPAPISILKSGVVEGMAYALYSDGSIEAQLPQGRLRFGSITELRQHIEHEPNDS